MTKSDEKRKNFPIKSKKEINVKNAGPSPIFMLSTFSIKSPRSKANPTNPSFESTGKKENLWDGNK